MQKYIYILQQRTHTIIPNYCTKNSQIVFSSL